MKAVNAVQILRLAKTMLEQQGAGYVCHAIKDAGRDLYLKEDAALLRLWVEESLGRNSQGTQLTVDRWLYRRGIELTPPQLHQYRIAWVSQMISLFEENAS